MLCYVVYNQFAQHQAMLSDPAVDTLAAVAPNPCLPQHLLQTAVQMHSENGCGGYCSNFTSYNSKWLSRVEEAVWNNPRRSCEVNKLLLEIFDESHNPYDSA